MAFDLAQTTLPLEDFLADRESGVHLIEKLTQTLVDRQKVLVWGPRVGAIELAENLLTLWPASMNQVVGINLVALWTRTRADGQDSGWIPWVDMTPTGLVEQVLSRGPEGVVLTYASPLAQPTLPKLMSGPFGFVTAIAASSAAEALERLQPLLGAGTRPFDVLVGLSETDKSTWISEVCRVDQGAPVRTSHLAAGRYVRA